MGAIFCQINIIMQFIHLKPSIISGNQKWNGAVPILVKRAEFIIIIKVEFILGEINSVNIIIIIIENRIIKEERAWVIKYFMADSDDNMFFVDVIRGMIDNKLISSPIHIPNQE